MPASKAKKDAAPPVPVVVVKKAVRVPVTAKATEPVAPVPAALVAEPVAVKKVRQVTKLVENAAIATPAPASAPAKAAKVAAPAKATTGAKRGPKAKAEKKMDVDELDMSDIEDDLAGEPEVVAPAGTADVAEATTEKVKPLRMKISKAKERALMKEFGLDETVLSEEDMAKRRQRLKALIKLGKTRGYLTHGEISDHLPDKLVDAETL
jgi:RNA polymerase primary sigma factor